MEPLVWTKAKFDIAMMQATGNDLEFVYTPTTIMIRRTDEELKPVKRYYAGCSFFNSKQPTFGRTITAKGYQNESDAIRDLEMLKALGYDCEIVYP